MKILDEYGLEVAIPSICSPGDVTYVVISRETERFVNEMSSPIASWYEGYLLRSSICPAHVAPAAPGACSIPPTYRIRPTYRTESAWTKLLPSPTSSRYL